jgi:RNA methyltransferase, TrmH family
MITKNQVKYIQSLSQKKLRDQESVFVAEGPKIIGELLTMSQVQPVGIYGTADWWQNYPQFKQDGVTHEISTAELERISFLSTPNMVLGIFRQPAMARVSGQWLILLDGIQDPGNLGTIIRIADWYGIQQIICSEDTADAFGSKVVQSSMGSIARVQLQYTNLIQFVRSEQGRQFYAAVLDGDKLSSVKPSGASALVIGNESAGIRKELLRELTNFITIPKNGAAESLNAAVATGILLSHLAI